MEDKSLIEKLNVHCDKRRAKFRNTAKYTLEERCA